LKEVTRTFAELGIDYMIVGSTAMWAYVPGRTTFDTDILVKMTGKQLDQLVKRYGDNWYLDHETARKQLADRRMCNAIHYATSWKLDLIPLKDEPFHQSEFSRRRKERLTELDCFVQSPEDLVLSKLQWAAKGGSARQIEDVRAILRGAPKLDFEYLGKWAEDLGLQSLLNEARDG
jgi:hypothetical protein